MKKQLIYTLLFVLPVIFTNCSDEQIYASWKRKNENFLKKNKDRAEIKTTKSGLQYEIIWESPLVERPKLGNYVKINYKTWTFKNSMDEKDLELIDSYVCEENSDKNSIFAVNGFISGIQEGITRMTAGSIWRMYIPQELAYGKDGLEGENSTKKKKTYKVKPYSVIIFEVEILAIY